MSCRGGEAPVACEERRVQDLRKRYVDGIVSGEAIAKLPRAGEQQAVGVAPHWEAQEVVDDFAAATRVNLARRGESADDLRDLHVEQVRGVQRLAGREQARLDSRRRLSSQQDFQNRRGVDDDQSRSRSARITSAGVSAVTTGVRERRRANNSSMDGR